MLHISDDQAVQVQLVQLTAAVVQAVDLALIKLQIRSRDYDINERPIQNLDYSQIRHFQPLAKFEQK